MKHTLYHLLRFLLVPGLMALCLTAPAHAKERTLLVLGDSISAAYGMSLEEGWVAQLADQLAGREPPVVVVNASISGETTGGALGRLPALLLEHQPEVVLIELGGNDGLRGFPPVTFRQNLIELARQSSDAGARVVILPMEIPPNYGARYAASFRDSYPLAAQETGSLLAPFILDGIATNPELMQGDGIHPRPEAQAAMLQNVLPAIDEALP
jgi:acyl-CoA thioesterase I